MSNSSMIPVTNHFIERYRKRIARSKRIEYFATEAFKDGKVAEKLDDTRLRTFIENKEALHSNSVLKVHKGFVYVFDSILNTAITVYRVPKLKNMVNR